MKKEITVKYGGFDLSPYFIVSSVTMPFLYKDNQYTQIGRSDGESLIYSRNAKTKITIQGTILTQETNLTVAETKDELINALKSDTVQQLTLSNYPGRYFNAIFDGSQDFDGTFDYIATVELVFMVPDGIAHSVATQTADNMPYKDVPVNLLKNTRTTSATSTTKAWGPLFASSQIYDSTIKSKSGVSAINFSFDVYVPLNAIAGSQVYIQLKGQNPQATDVGPDDWNTLLGKSDYVIKQSDLGKTIRVTAPVLKGSNYQSFDTALTDTVSITIRQGNGIPGFVYSYLKLEIGNDASPWSPNPADPEYYSDTITVPNAGTYPSEPVITATINGDDGVLTGINDQGSVLQFGSPDETDGFVKQKSERVYHLDFNQTPTGV
ncbi:MAG: distal tail protein Dit, partial [Lacticaseibacillus paracasei]